MLFTIPSGKFFDFRVDGLYGCTIHPINLQFWLLFWNTLFFTPVGLKYFLHLFCEEGGGSGHKWGNLMSTLCSYFPMVVVLFGCELKNI